MKSKIAVLVDFELLKELENAYIEHGDMFDPTNAVEYAMSYFSQQMDFKADDIMPEELALVSRGYTWKYKHTSIFLPHGTDIRMSYMKKYHYAKVEDDEIMYLGKSVTPSALANIIAQKNRNAWKYIWIKRPGKENWVLADDERKRIMKAYDEIDLALGIGKKEKDQVNG